MAIRGNVVSFDRHKGYGFVAAESGGEDVFLHVNDLLDDKNLLSPGSVVEFVIQEGDRGPKASAVSIIQPAPDQASLARHHHATDADGEDMCDVLSASAFEREITEALLRADPPLISTQILEVRKLLKNIAQNHGWVDR